MDRVEYTLEIDCCSYNPKESNSETKTICGFELDINTFHILVILCFASPFIPLIIYFVDSLSTLYEITHRAP